MATLGDRRERQSCPCLYSDDAPLCRAELQCLHVPPRSHLERYCSRPEYRRCALYRAWLATIEVAPDGWTGEVVASDADGGTGLALSTQDAGREQTTRKEDLMLAILRKLISDERAQDLAEYGIALSIVAAGVFAAAMAIRNHVTTVWTLASGIVAGAA